MAIETTKQSSLYTMLMATVFVLVGSASIRGLAADDVDFLSDRDTGIQMRHHQRWGDLGFDTAAARGRGTGTPLRIGEKTYAKGMGHHANGEIVIDLNGRYSRFRTGVGVQWQGGKKGSVIFRVVVDGKNKFQTGPMSDSDPVRQVDVSLVGARELRLTADDAGDGIACDMANWVEACLVQDPRIPFFGNHAVSFDGEAAPARTAAAGGFALIARGSGPQVAVMETARTMTVSVERDEQVRWTIQVKSVVKPVRIMADVRVIGGGQAQVGLSLGPERVTRSVRHGERVVLATEPVGAGSKSEIVVVTRGGDEETGVRWSNLRYALGDQVFPIPMVLPQAAESFPLPVLPDLRPLIEQELVEWDWRMQDGIDTVQEPRTWQHAIETILQRGDRLITHLVLTGVSLEKLAAQWEAARQRHLTMARADGVSELEWEALWREVHALRRQIALANPLVDLGPLLFVKRVPSGFSHQLTQYAGRHARAGGGVFVLDTPGRSMRARRIDSLPSGSFLHPEVSWDGKRVLFAFCKTDPGGFRPSAQTNQYYHLFEMSADGSNLRQLTEGPFDDFSARYLPNGKIMFISTRRGGYHRCGRGPCPT
ncbi:MAG TPA: NPCBM/NEW2 domain-containing protein, partial [Verrucomicrobiota bacterium]|nr:NPCBM/NEW2 domain-containing protein [Verrucomicrobiota bacterium]